MTSELPQSRFNMWRAVVAMIHADHVVKPHEINFILKHTKDIPMSVEQRGELMDDLSTAASIDEIFGQITNPVDREDFFHLARALAWADGHFDEREQTLLNRLKGSGWKIPDNSYQNFIQYMDSGILERRDPVVVGMIKSLLGSRA